LAAVVVLKTVVSVITEVLVEVEVITALRAVMARSVKETMVVLVQVHGIPITVVGVAVVVQQLQVVHLHPEQLQVLAVKDIHLQSAEHQQFTVPAVVVAVRHTQPAVLPLVVLVVLMQVAVIVVVQAVLQLQIVVVVAVAVDTPVHHGNMQVVTADLVSSSFVTVSKTKNLTSRHKALQCFNVNGVSQRG
jgi:hypothetical protein